MKRRTGDLSLIIRPAKRGANRGNPEARVGEAP
jgi:hypothetical protein